MTRRFPTLSSMFIILAWWTLTITPTLAQRYDPVKWKFHVKESPDGDAILIFTATLEPGWHIYSLSQENPMPTVFHFEENSDVELIQGVVEKSESQQHYDDTFQANISWFADTAVFSQRIKVKVVETEILGKIKFMACTGKMCLPQAEVEFDLEAKGLVRIKPKGKPKTKAVHKTNSQSRLNIKNDTQETTNETAEGLKRL